MKLPEEPVVYFHRALIFGFIGAICVQLPNPIIGGAAIGLCFSNICYLFVYLFWCD